MKNPKKKKKKYSKNYEIPRFAIDRSRNNLCLANLFVNLYFHFALKSNLTLLAKVIILLTCTS